nr:hypothetical protein [Tanacetum cinerariifolium]
KNQRAFVGGSWSDSGKEDDEKVKNETCLEAQASSENPNGNGNLVVARAEGNETRHNGNQMRCYNCRGLGHLARNCTVKPRRRDDAYLQTQLLIAQKEEARIQPQAEEFDLMDASADLDEIEKVNANCILMANLQQASTSGTQTDKAFVYDSDGSAEVKSTIMTLPRVVKHRMTLDAHNWSSSAHQELHKIVKDEIFPIVNQVDARVQNFEIQFLKEASKFVRDFMSLAKEADEFLAKHKALELEIERLLRAVKLENENVELEFQVLNYAKESAHLKTTYKNLFDSVSVTRTQTKTIIDSLQNELHDTIYENAKLRVQLFDKVPKQKDTTRGTSANTKFAKHSIMGKPPSSSKNQTVFTSNSIPIPQESKVVKNDKVVAPGMFRINPFKPSKEEKYVPNKLRASVRTNPITVSQPPVITKKLKSNTKNDRVPSASKSSCSKNKEVEVEEHPRNLLLSKNKKHMSSACNNVKLATQNVKSKVVCAMCQCFNQRNHKKQKPKVKKPKKVGFIERLASPKPSKPRYFLRWSLTGRLFDLKGKIIASSESESQSDCSKGANACTSNLMEPTIKRFPNSTFSLAGYPNMFMVHRLGLFQAYDRESKAYHKFLREVFGNCSLQPILSRAVL